MQRIKIVSNVDAAAVVNQVNKLLQDSWQILSEHVVNSHAVSSSVLLVPCYVVYLIKDEKFEGEE